MRTTPHRTADPPAAGRDAARSDAARRMSRGGRPCVDDRGSSSVEMAILFPIIVVLLLAGTQAAVWFYGRQAAQAAAQAGVRAASVHEAPAGAGPDAATEFLATAGANLSAVTVTASTADGQVTVAVTGTVPLVIPLPGLTPTVSVTVTRPLERFTTPGGPP